MSCLSGAAPRHEDLGFHLAQEQGRCQGVGRTGRLGERFLGTVPNSQFEELKTLKESSCSAAAAPNQRQKLLPSPGREQWARQEPGAQPELAAGLCSGASPGLFLQFSFSFSSLACDPLGNREKCHHLWCQYDGVQLL